MFNVHGLLYIQIDGKVNGLLYIKIDGKVNVQCSWIIIYINRWKSKCSMFMDYYIYIDRWKKLIFNVHGLLQNVQKQ